MDDGYYIFRQVRNSPAYLDHSKKELFAMIRQLGLPTWFMSLSAADTKWVDLHIMLGKLVDKKDYTKDVSEGKLEKMIVDRLIRSDPVTCSCYFDHRVQQFMNIIIKNAHNPLRKDSFIRVEFQHRGSPYVHMLLWFENAPQYGVSRNEEVISYIDKRVSCSLDVCQDHLNFVKFQKHLHSRSCRKGGKAMC